MIFRYCSSEKAANMQAMMRNAAAGRGQNLDGFFGPAVSSGRTRNGNRKENIEPILARHIVGLF